MAGNTGDSRTIPGWLYGLFVAIAWSTPLGLLMLWPLLADDVGNLSIAGMMFGLAGSILVPFLAGIVHRSLAITSLTAFVVVTWWLVWLITVPVLILV